MSVMRYMVKTGGSNETRLYNKSSAVDFHYENYLINVDGNILSTRTKRKNNN